MRTLKEFHEFFSKIPHEQWTSREFVSSTNTNMKDALGHTFVYSEEGFVPSASSYKLLELLDGMKQTLVSVNDKPQPGFPQARPKARVLAFIESAMSKK